MSSSEEISIPPPAPPPPPSASSSSHNGVGLLGGLNSHHPHHHHHHHHHPQHILFQEETNSATNPTLPYSCPPPPNHHHRRHPLPDPKTRPLSSLLDHTPTPTPSSDRHPHHRFFPQGPDFTRSIFGDDHCPQPPDPTDDWNNDNNNNDSASSADDDDSNDDDPVEEEDDDDDDDEDAHPILPLHNHNKKSCNENDNSKCATEAAAVSNANGNGRNPKHHLLPPFGGSAGEVMVEKDGRFGLSAPTLPTATTTPTTTTTTTTTTDSDGDMYYAHYLHSTEGPAPPPPPHQPHPHPHPHAHGGENGCGFSGRKDLSSSFSTDCSRDSLRSILSDPVTGELMDDAMILPCGHSFGGAGMQHVLRNKACYNCSRAISEDLFAPNLSLRAAVLAFHREEELQCHRSSKRRKERFYQDKGDSTVIDPSRGKGVQFPFAVTDRVIIKGNKRTPQRFVGREAVVTTQCLNGWYVVKTLDNAESVKLQYRSLARVSDETSSKAMQSKMGQHWL